MKCIRIIIVLMAVMFGQGVMFAQNVAKIGDTEYETLADAVNAVPTDGTETIITLIGNAANTAALNIATGKNVVLDLQGYSVSRSLNTAADDGHVIGCRACGRCVGSCCAYGCCAGNSHAEDD